MDKIKTPAEVIEIKPQELSKEDQVYKGAIFKRMEQSRDTREVSHVEFDGMGMNDWVQFNAKTANSSIPPRKNKADTSIVTGTPRNKMKAIISHIMKMNLDADVLAYDKDKRQDIVLGKTMSKLIKKAQELDTTDWAGGREEKQRMRLRGLLEQGTVFVEERYTPRTIASKNIIEGKLTPADGFKGLKWITKMETDYKCESKLLDISQVYLGNIKQFEMNRQPFIYTRKVMDYSEAMTIYGKWTGWDNVVPGNKYSYLDDGSDSIPYRDFRLYELQTNQVEIIEYQDLPNCEYNIFINGVMMLPSKFPMPWAWKGYSITKSVLHPYSDQFAYGKSLMQEVRVDGELLDEMIRMLIHKTKQSIKPPMANKNKGILSPRIYDPGTLWSGLDVTKLNKIIDHQGVTSSEFQMFGLINDIVDKKTINPTMQGQETGGNPTATQIMLTQKQAEVNLYLILFAVQIMEERVSYLKLFNILSNWTKPIDYEVDGVTKKLKEVYRKEEVDDEVIEFENTEPGGKDRINTSFRMMEEQQLAEKVKSGTKSRVVIHLPLLKKLRYKFYIKVNASERASDNLNKVLFGEMMNQVVTYFPEELNREYFQKEWAIAWDKNPAEAFQASSMEAMEGMVGDKGKQPPVANKMAGGVKASPKQLMK